MKNKSLRMCQRNSPAAIAGYLHVQGWAGHSSENITKLAKRVQLQRFNPDPHCCWHLAPGVKELEGWTGTAIPLATGQWLQQPQHCSLQTHLPRFSISGCEWELFRGVLQKCGFNVKVRVFVLGQLFSPLTVKPRSREVFDIRAVRWTV